MSDFHKEAEHERISFMFDQDTKDKYASRLGGKAFVISDKEYKRIQSMLDSTSEFACTGITMQEYAIQVLMHANNVAELLAMQAGLLKIPEPKGVAICTACLAKTILAFEENIETLKDIQKVVNDYATK